MQLRRLTTSGKWIPEIDGLRAVAILSVLLDHSLGLRLNSATYPITIQPRYAWFAYRMLAGGRGVMVFFAISGYILAKPFMAAYTGENVPRKFNLWTYYRRRLTRLEPPYIISLILYLFAFVLALHDSLRSDLAPLLYHVLYIHNFLPTARNLNLATWSLEVEVQFYLVAPVLGLIFLIRSTSTRWISWFCLIVVATWVGLKISALGSPFMLSVSLLGNLMYFLVGFLLADIHEATEGKWRHWAWDLIAVFAWPTVYLWPENTWLPLVLPMAVFVAFASTLFGPKGKAVLSLKPIAIIGGMCYSIYLMHMLCFSVFGRLVGRFDKTQDFLLTFSITLVTIIPLTLIVGACFYIAIERPCMDPKWPEKLFQWASSKKDGRPHEISA